MATATATPTLTVTTVTTTTTRVAGMVIVALPDTGHWIEQHGHAHCSEGERQREQLNSTPVRYQAILFIVTGVPTIEHAQIL